MRISTDREPLCTSMYRLWVVIVIPMIFLIDCNNLTTELQESVSWVCRRGCADILVWPLVIFSKGLEDYVGKGKIELFLEKTPCNYHIKTNVNKPLLDKFT